MENLQQLRQRLRTRMSAIRERDGIDHELRDTLDELGGVLDLTRVLDTVELNLRLATQTYLNVAEAAAYLRYNTTAAFQKWARQGLVPKCRSGRRILYRRRDLDRQVQPEYLKHWWKKSNRLEEP